MRKIHRGVLLGTLLVALLIAGGEAVRRSTPRGTEPVAAAPAYRPPHRNDPRHILPDAATAPALQPSATPRPRAEDPAGVPIPGPVAASKRTSMPPPPPFTKTPELILFLRPEAEAAAVGRRHGLQPIRPLDGNPLAWVFRATSVEAADTARLAAKADPVVTNALPNRLLHLSKFAFVPDDPYYPSGSPSGFPGQWHLPRANVPAAWNRELTGAGVQISIVDDGIEFGHPDLAGNFSASDSRNFAVFPSDTNYGPDLSRDGNDDQEDRHGTSVAGVAAAVGGNGIGVTGAAPKAKVAINRLDFVNGQSDASLMDAVTYHASGANTTIKMKNHSYGYSVPYVDGAAEASAVATSALAGTLHIYAAGNYRNSDAEDANKLMPQNNPDVICVAALGSDNKYANYSSFGANVLVTAPSSSSSGLLDITTTDRTTTAGYNPYYIHPSPPGDPTGIPDPFPDQNYTSLFGGTSSAAPLVTGILALGKQANPLLNVRMAQHALVRASDQVDATDATISGGGDGTTSGSAWKTNAAGYKFNQNYGFGVINADKFILEAVKYAGVSEATPETHAAAVNTAIPDNNATGVDKTFVVAATTPLESIEVTLNLTHPYRGDLEATVTSPSGTVCRLMRRAFDSGDFPDLNWSFNAWTFLSNAFWGENPAGTWHLRVADVQPGDLGTWNSYSFTAHMGTPILDTTPPAVVSITRAGSSPTNANPLAFTVTFSEYVTGVNASDFALATTGTISGASILSVSGGPTTYTVSVDPGSGAGTIGLNLLDNDSIVDGAGNPLGGAGAGPTFTGAVYSYDATPPTVSVTSTTADGIYAAGASVNITLTFSKAVTLAGGNLQVTLDTGAVIALPPFASQSSVSSTYTVGPGETSADLTVQNPLTLLGGATLRDAFGNNTTLTIATAQNLAFSRAITIDAAPPTGGVVLDGFSGADLSTQTSLTTMAAHWSGFTDPGTGLAGYRWAIGTSPGSTNILPYTDVGLATQASTSMANGTLALSVGTKYYVTVEARDGGGTTSTASSDGVQVVAGAGVTVPEAPPRLDALAQPSAIQLVWQPSPTAGVTTYRLWWKPTASPWTVATLVDGLTGTTATVSPLSNGTAYDFQLRALLPGGNESSGAFASGTPSNAITLNGGGNYATIQAALNAAVAGDTVSVIPGTYPVNLTLPGGVTLAGASPKYTILTAANPAADVLTATGGGTLSTVTQFTITGGLAGVNVGSANVLLRNLVIHHNSSHGVSSLVAGQLQAINCTIMHNGGSGISAAGTTTIRNVIAGANAQFGLSAPAASSVTYSDAYGNPSGDYSAGLTLTTDSTTPVTFTDEPANDYTEAPGAFSVDAGDPLDAFALEPAYNGNRINLGAYGNTAWAATSPVPPAPSGGGGGGGCGLTGVEGLLLLACVRARRR